MKNLKMLVVVALITGMAAFTGCKKEDAVKPVAVNSKHNSLKVESGGQDDPTPSPHQ